MSGTTGRSNLATIGRGPDVNFVGEYDITKERPYHKAKPLIREQFDISPVSGSITAGQEIYFELDKRADRLGKMELIIQRGAATGVGVFAFNDWEGYSWIDTISGQYSNKVFWNVTGDELFMQTDMNDKVQRRASKAIMQNGDLTLAQRVVTTANSATVVVDLQSLSDNLKRQFAMVGLPNKIRIILKLKTLDRVGNNISTVPNLQTYLRCQYWHLRQPDRKALWQQASGTKSGIITKYARNEYHRFEVVPAMTGLFRLKLRNTKNAAYLVWAMTRLQSHFTTPNVDLFDNLIEPLWFELQDNGSAVTERIFVKNAPGVPGYGKYVNNQEMFPEAAKLGRPYPTVAFCPHELVQASDTDCMGSRTLSRYNNLEFVAMFDPVDLPTAAYIDVYARIHDLMITKNGDLMRFLQ